MHDDVVPSAPARRRRGLRPHEHAAKWPGLDQIAYRLRRFGERERLRDRWLNGPLERQPSRAFCAAAMVSGAKALKVKPRTLAAFQMMAAAPDVAVVWRQPDQADL